MEQRKTQRRAAVIGLAVAATVSVVSVTWTRLHAEATTPDSGAARPLSLADASASDSDLLKQAVAQYKAKQYEDAKATLAQINAANLPNSDQRALTETGDNVEKALAGRTEARARFEEAESAMTAGNLPEAKRLYKSAADSKFADDGTKQKAREQAAAVDAMQEQKAGEQKAQYQQAKRDFEAGNLAESKAAFEKLRDTGYKAPMFQGSPSDFLKKIDQKTAAAAPTGEAAVAVDTGEKKAEAAPAVAPAAVPPVADATAKAPDEQAKIDQKAADEAAKAEKRAAELQAKADKKAAEDQAKAEKKAAEDQAKADKKAADEAAKAQQQKAKEAYAAGLTALKANDYATARSQFKAADEAGFKPGIFQASAPKMLAEVDKVEAKAQAKAAEETAKAEAPTAQAPAAGDTNVVVPVVVPPAPKTETPAAQQPAVAAPAVAAPAVAAPAVEAPKAEAPKVEVPKVEQPAAEAPKAEAPAVPEAPAADANAAKTAYAAGLAAMKAGDYATARTQFQAADAAGFKPGLFEASAAKMLAKVDQAEVDAKAHAEKQAAADAEKEQAAKADADRRAAAAQAKAEKEAAEAQAKAEKKAAEDQARADRDAAKVAADAEKTSAATRQVAARDQYKTGLTALKAGDYTAARAGFKAADEAGFKPGLFEATAAKMLTEVDREEARAQAKAQELAAKEAAKAEAPVAEAPKAEVPAVEVPKAETPKAETPVPEAPKAETPKVETPVAETPKAEAPKAETTKVEVPVAVANPAQSELDATAKMEQIRQQARAYDAQRLVDQAKKAQQEGRTADALDAYTKAVEKDPTNQAALDGRNQLLTLQGRPPVVSTLLTRQEQLNISRRGAITYAFNEAVDRARAAIAQNNYKVAQQQADAAAVARQTDPTLFNQDQLKAFDTTLAQVQVELKTAQLAFNAAEKQRLTEEALRASEARQAAQDKERRETVAALIKDARRYIQQNRYHEALATIDQIVAVDPTNDYATGVRPLVEDRALLQEQRELREQTQRDLSRHLNLAQEKLIPYSDIYHYPTNWPTISDDRDRFTESEQGVGEADRAVRAALEKKQPQVKFDGTPFDDVVDLLRDTTGVNILVNWKQLEQAGIDRKTAVQARLRDVKLSKVLDEVLRQVSTDPTNKLTYTVDEGVITISTLSELSGNVVTRVYEVTDLMADATQIANGNNGGGGNGGTNGGTTGGNRNTGGGGGGNRNTGGGGGNRNTGGGGGGSLFGGGGGGGNNNSGNGNSNGGDTSSRMDEISDLIVSTVAVNTWEDSGGTGTIRPFYQNLQLIISQTPEVHREVESLLAKLRERSAIQVSVEARFLAVSRNFLEDIGMDFDATWNPGGNWAPMSFTQNSEAFTANPATAVPSSLGAQSPAIQINGAYLDDFQVNFMIRATQAQVTQSVVTAPRVTVFNGGTAYVNVSVDQNYVSGFDAATVPGIPGAPQISTVTSGVYLEVSAFVSHDRKYVRLQLYPQLTKLLGMDVFTFQQAASASTGTGNNTNTGTIIAGAPTTSVQEPVVQSIDLATDVSVPDGGTVLLGGQTIAGEIEREAGVPVLSKLPIIKRFFTNRSMAKDESILLILVKPTIIIAKEQEQKQFPLLSSKISGQ